MKNNAPTTGRIKAATILKLSERLHRRSLQQQEEQREFKVDMGRQKDAWMELYGNSVLNNTLQVERSIIDPVNTFIINVAIDINV